MTKSTSSLTLPDVNLWLALASHEHVHFQLARFWLEQQAGFIAFNRMTQLGLLRLLTTSSVMSGKPLTMDQAWRIYERFYEDSRVTFLPEPANVELLYRSKATGEFAAPKLWADAWLLAFAQAAGGTVITFDRALARRGAHCLL